MEKNSQGVTIRELSQEYNKPYKTIKNMVTRENNKLKKDYIRIELLWILLSYFSHYYSDDNIWNI